MKSKEPEFNKIGLLSAIDGLISFRENQVRREHCLVTAEKTEALATLKRHIDFVRGGNINAIAKMIIRMQDNITRILPSEKSKFYASQVGKWEWIKTNISNLNLQ